MYSAEISTKEKSKESSETSKVKKGKEGKVEIAESPKRVIENFLCDYNYCKAISQNKNLSSLLYFRRR